MLFAVLLTSITLSFTQYISFSSPSHDYVPFISLSFRNLERPLSVPINTQIPFTRFTSPTLNLFKSNCVNDHNFTYECKGDIELNGKILLSNFNFSIPIKQTFSIDMRSFGIGVAHTFSDESLSFVHLLYKRKLVQGKEFSIQFGLNQMGNIHFGGKPSIEYPNSGHCKVVSDRWGCGIKKIYYGRKSYDFEIFADFNTAIDNTIESLKFFEFVSYNVIPEKRKSKQCEIFDDFDQKDLLYCAKGALDDTENITFVFDNNLHISIPFKSLFISNGVSYFSKFSYDFYNRTRFEFGYSFFKLFNMTTFDYATSTVVFHSYDTAINGKLQTYGMEYIYICIDIICIASIILMCIIYNQSNK